MKYLKKFNSKTAIIIHGYGVESNDCFYPWLKSELESIGYNVELPKLPNPHNPNVDEQVDYILDNYPSKKNIIIGHSFGCPVAMKLVEKLDYSIDSLFLVCGFTDTNFGDEDDDEVLINSCDWKFNFSDIKSKTNVYILRPKLDTSVTLNQTKDMSRKFGVPISYFSQIEDHACGSREPELLSFIKKHI